MGWAILWASEWGLPWAAGPFRVLCWRWVKTHHAPQAPWPLDCDLCLAQVLSQLLGLSAEEGPQLWVFYRPHVGPGLWGSNNTFSTIYADAHSPLLALLYWGWQCGRQLGPHERSKGDRPATEGHQGGFLQVPSNRPNWENKSLPPG